MLSQKRILTGISKFGVRSPSCEVILSDQSEEEKKNAQNITHNVTDDEISDNNVDLDIPDTHRNVNKPMMLPQENILPPSKGRIVNMLNTQKYSSFGTKQFLFNKIPNEVVAETTQKLRRPALPPSGQKEPEK